MTVVAKLLDEFKGEFRAGRSPNPRSYLERLDGAERSQLEGAIDRFLVNEPRRRFDATAFATSPARRLAENLERSMTGQAGLWPSLLPRLRARSRLRRAELIERLAISLRTERQAAKVGAYYHRMEQGTIPARGVSDRVLAELGKIVGVSAERLRSAGEAFDPMQGEQGVTTAFARTGSAGPGHDGNGNGSTRPLEAAPQEPDWDDVDRLFRGG